MSNGLNAPQRARYSDHSLAAYVSPLVQARRVGVVGPTSGELARRFRALGAATVVAFGGTGDGIAVRALTPGAIASFHGKLDCIVVPDAAAVALDAVLDESRRALGQDGVLVVASQPPGAPRGLEDAAAGGARAAGPDYYDLLDALGARFAAVQMLGRGAFVGYTIASLTEPAGELSLDTRLMPDDPAPAEAFIAVASDNGVALDAQALVQVPAAEVLAAAPTPAVTTTVVDTAAVERAASLEQEVAKRDAKLKEIENASAERWVKIQRLEHELKGLDEEARKARDRAAKLTKDLEDERKLRQRIELDAQMTRRAPELPRGADPEELGRARARVTQLEHELAAAHAELGALKSRVADLDRELDETQATEAELRAALDEAERAAAAARKAPAREKSAPAAPPPSQPLPAVDLDALRAELDASRAALAAARADAARARATLEAERAAGSDEREYVRLETELRARAEELIAARRQLAERDAAVRELAYSLSAASQLDAARDAQAARERAAELASLNASLAAEASGIVEQNELLRERVAQLEGDLVARANEAQEASYRASELAAQLAAARTSGAAASEHGATGETSRAVAAGDATAALAELEAARAELAAVRVAASIAQQAERDQTARAHEAQSLLEEVRRALEEERTRAADARARLEEARRARDAGHDEGAAPAADAEQLAQARRERDEARRAADEERARASETSAQLAEARNDLARQYAVIASIEDRVVQTRQELDGARAGYTRRVRELEREIDQLVQALEIAGTHSTDEADSLGHVLREVETLKAERKGIAMRLADAEASLEAQASAAASSAPSTSTSLGDAATERGGAGARADELLADLSETAARLASTEEELSLSREATVAAERRVAELSRAVDSLRGELAAAARPASDVTPEQVDALRRESAERELLVRSLVAQLEDRDLRLRAMERRLVEDVERARRTESEIWEVELRARDQRIMALSREVERARSAARPEGGAHAVPSEVNGGEAHEVGALRAALEGRERELGALRAALEQVRTGLSSILVDGRGAVVAHDLVSILRQIEEPQPPG